MEYRLPPLQTGTPEQNALWDHVYEYGHTSDWRAELNSTTPERHMKCPICADETAGQETQKWGPEWAHVRCVRAYNLGRADAIATADHQPVEPACPVCNRTPVFERDRRVNEWAGHCKNCAVEGPVAATEAEARRLWVVWHHKRSDAQSLLFNTGDQR